MTTVRTPAVAGMFYAGEEKALQHDVDVLLGHIQKTPTVPGKVKAIVAPHAGYIYSGLTQAAAYLTLRNLVPDIKTILLLGPTHHVATQKLAAPSQDYFQTPLGDQVIAQSEITRLLDNIHVAVMDEAHVKEHSLEVQIPFIQKLFPDSALIPLAVGHVAPEIVAEVITPYWEDEHSMIIISTDLSHFHTYDEAKTIDTKTTEYIETLNYEALNPHMACGSFPLKGLMYLAKNKSAHIKLLHQCNSGDTAGDKSRVVGYGAYIAYEP